MAITVVRPRRLGVGGSAAITIMYPSSGSASSSPDPGTGGSGGGTPTDITKAMPYTTLESLVEDVKLWLRGNNAVEDMQIKGAVNDGIDSLWMSLTRASLSLFMGGPVNVSIGSGEERATIVAKFMRDLLYVGTVDVHRI